MRRRPIQKFVIGFVLTLHTCLLWFLLAYTPEKKLISPTKPIVVRQITVNPATMATKPAPAKPAAPVAKPTPPKPPEPEPIAEAEPTPPPPAPPKEKPKPKPKPEPAPKPVAKEKPKPKPEPKVEPKVEPKPIAKPTPKPAVKETPKPVAKPVVKETPKKPTKSPAKEPPKETAKAPPKPDPEREKLLAAIRKNLEGVSTKEKAPTAATNQPAVRTLSTATTAAEQAAITAAYISSLVDSLKAQLRLPDVGDVEVELTLAKSGKVLKLKVVSTKSERNRQYIENALPSLRFTAFEGDLVNESQHTFHLNLANE